MKFILSTFMFVALLATASNASPVTVTFDPTISSHNPETNSDIGTSQGFSYEFSYVYLSGAHIAFHDDGGILSSTIKPVNGSIFTPRTIDVSGYSRLNKSGEGAPPVEEGRAHDAWSKSGTAQQPQLSFIGLRNGKTVANQSVGPTAKSTISFSNAFGGIDALLLSLNIPAGALQYTYPEDIRTPNTLWCYEWCAGFTVDDLAVSTDTITPVPLPAGGVLFLSALFGLGYFKTRARA